MPDCKLQGPNDWPSYLSGFLPTAPVPFSMVRAGLLVLEHCKDNRYILNRLACRFYRVEVAAVYYVNYFGKYPAIMGDLAHPHVKQEVERFERYVGLLVLSIGKETLEQEAAKDEARMQAALKEAARKANELQRHKPSAAGTTEELAELLGVSKKEVRRLRAAGELDASLAAL